MTQSLSESVSEAIHFLYSSYNRLSKVRHTGYDRDVRNPHWTRELLDRLGSPDRTGYNISVTGSKGKGSHSILVAGILQQMGYRVGLFTSPHLVDFLERIRVQGEMISEEDFLRLIAIIRPIIDGFDVPKDEYVGPVGMVAAMAAVYFQEQRTDFNIFELGRGALHDDVNQVAHRGAVFTPIFPEHLDRLGPQWEDVVREKMGIVTKDTAFAVSYRQEAMVHHWMADHFPSHASCRLAYLDEDFDVRMTLDGDVEEQTAKVEAIYEGNVYRARIGSALIPFYDNVGVALVASAMAIRDYQSMRPSLVVDEVVPVSIDVDLTELVPPGRLHEVRSEPTVVIDGSIHAVNAVFVRRLVEARRMTRASGRVVAVLSLPDDKDAEGVIGALCPVVDRLIFTKCSNAHLSYTRDMRAFIKAFKGSVEVLDQVERAFHLAMEGAGVNDLILCVGTQSFVGDALRYFDVPTGAIWRPSSDGGLRTDIG